MVYSNNFNQVRVGVRNGVVTQVVNAVDADATAFIAAAGITNLTQAAAISTLVDDLKTYGLWTKMKALYPFVGGSASSHKFNLKDPRDLDAAFRLVFSGGWTHTSTGATPNGTTGYADTYLTPSTSLLQDNTHLSYYSRTNISSSQIEIGCLTDPNRLSFEISWGGTLSSDQYNYSTGRVSYTNPDSRGFYVGSRTNSVTHKAFKNGTQVGTTNTGVSNGISNINGNIRVGGVNNTSTGTLYYSSKEAAFASIGEGLSDTDASNFYTAVQKFNSTLGRQVGTPVVSDSDATAFISASGITNNEQANAVNTLVTDLKTAGIWTKMKAIYPFVGGTAASHKWNLKDPRDVDAAFRLSFTGGWTHTSTGALPNGSNAYAETKFSEYNNITNGDSQLSNYSHLSLYSRTNASSLDTYGGIGVYDYQDYGSSFVLTLKRADGLSYAYSKNINTTPVSMPDSRGFFILNRQSNSLLKYNRNDVLIAQNTSSAGAGGTRNGVTLGSAYDWGRRYYDNKEHAFVSIGFSLTDTESTALYNSVQKFQTALGRQIGTPVLPDGQIAKLLDSYTGAAAAYSLRKLRTAYSGYAIRVRRSSDNLEQDISFKADGTLDTASLLAFVGNGNGFVSIWYDQSGNALDAVQASSSWQPQIIISGVLNTYNGKPSVKFDGVDDFIQSPYAAGTSNEMYFVTQTTDTGFLFPRGQHGQGFIAEQGSTNTQTSGYWTTQPQLYVNSILRSPANRNDVYNLLNGYKLSVHKGANISNNFIYLRFGSFIQNGYLDFNGNLFEWIIYPTLQSSQTSIESNINSYYSIY